MAQNFKETYCPDPKLYGEGYDAIDWSSLKKEEPTEKPADEVVEEFENPYYLKMKGRNSDITDKKIRDIFENIHRERGYQGTFSRGLSGCYNHDFIQTKWEDFYNGFRLGEDHCG